MSSVFQCNSCDSIFWDQTLSDKAKLFIVDMPYTGERRERLGNISIGPDKKWKVIVRLDESNVHLCRACSQRLMVCLSHQWLEPEEEGEKDDE